MCEDLDPDDDNDIVSEEVFKFGMTIVYMSTSFPTIERIDNLSSKAYTVELISNANASKFMGKFVKLLAPNSQKEKLTEKNLPAYLDNYAKIYEGVSINDLYFIFSEEVEPCLLNACKTSITSADGNNISDSFISLSASNEFKERKVLKGIRISLEKPLSTKSGLIVELTNYRR